MKKYQLAFFALWSLIGWYVLNFSVVKVVSHNSGVFSRYGFVKIHQVGFILACLAFAALFIYRRSFIEKITWIKRLNYIALSVTLGLLFCAGRVGYLFFENLQPGIKIRSYDMLLWEVYFLAGLYFPLFLDVLKLALKRMVLNKSINQKAYEAK